MKAALKKLPFVIFLLSPTIVVASGCGDYTSDGQQICETYYTCKWESNACTERCPTNNNGQCVHLTGCFLASSDDGGMGGQVTLCQPCLDTEYNDGTFQTCQLCSTALSAPKIFDSANATYGQSECPWMCDANYYKSGDSCEICPTGATSPAGSDDVNDCICPTGTHLAYNNGTYSCEQCSCTPPENGSCTTTYNETTGCQTTITCDVGYYKTETSGTVSCTACPAGTTSNAGSTAKSACKMTHNTKFCDAGGQNCMKLIPNGVEISATN